MSRLKYTFKVVCHNSGGIQPNARKENSSITYQIAKLISQWVLQNS